MVKSSIFSIIMGSQQEAKTRRIKEQEHKFTLVDLKLVPGCTLVRLNQYEPDMTIDRIVIDKYDHNSPSSISWTINTFGSKDDKGYQAVGAKTFQRVEVEVIMDGNRKFYIKSANIYDPGIVYNSNEVDSALYLDNHHYLSKSPSALQLAENGQDDFVRVATGHILPFFPEKDHLISGSFEAALRTERKLPAKEVLELRFVKKVELITVDPRKKAFIDPEKEKQTIEIASNGNDAQAVAKLVEENSLNDGRVIVGFRPFERVEGVVMVNGSLVQLTSHNDYTAGTTYIGEPLTSYQALRVAEEIDRKNMKSSEPSASSWIYNHGYPSYVKTKTGHLFPLVATTKAKADKIVTLESLTANINQ